MKSQDIEIGKVYIARVSGQLANVRVERRVDSLCDTAGRSHGYWLCENLETGRKVRIKRASRFRREASKFVDAGAQVMDYPVVFTNTSDPRTVVVQDPALIEEQRQRAERGIEVAARLKRRWSLAEATTSQPNCPRCGGVRGHGLSGCPACLEDRREGTLPEAPLGRNALVEQFKAVAPAHADNITEGVATNNERTRSMHIAESDARSLLRALGNKNADSLAVPELEQRLNQPKKLAKHLEGKVLEEADLNNLRNIADATKEGEKVVVVADKVGETVTETEEQEGAVQQAEIEETQPEEQPTMKAHANGRAKPHSKAKKTSKPKAENGRTKPHDGEDIDPFGNRLNSDLAKINSVLGRKPKKMAELVQEAGLEGTFYDHLNRLVKKGLVEKTDKGYVRAK